MTDWQNLNQRPTAGELAATRQAMIREFTAAAREAQKSGVPQMVDGPGMDGVTAGEWFWDELAAQYRCDISGPYAKDITLGEDGTGTTDGFYFLVTPRKEGPPRLWKNDVLYDVRPDSVATIRAAIEAWLIDRGCAYELVDRTDLGMLQVRLKEDDPAFDLAEAHGGLFMRARFLTNITTREEMQERAVFPPEHLTFRA